MTGGEVFALAVFVALLLAVIGLAIYSLKRPQSRIVTFDVTFSVPRKIERRSNS